MSTSTVMNGLMDKWSDEDRERLSARCKDRNVHVFDITPSGHKQHACVVCGADEAAQLSQPIEWRLPHA